MQVKRIWNRLVPTTTCIGILSMYTMIGTIRNPPPTPMIAARMPTNPPRTMGTMME